MTAFTLKWFGHGTWSLDTGKGTLLVDPFFSGQRVNGQPVDYILVSHGHEDHVAAVESLLTETETTLVSNVEVCNWFAERGARRTEPMNLGGTIRSPFGTILMTQAVHSSTMPDGTPGGNPCGFVVSLSDGKSRDDLMPLTKELSANGNIYFACDTGLFGEMSWIGSLGIAAAVLPIGDRYTMGPAMSLDAIVRIRPRYVLPSHYDTWLPIAQDVEAWSGAVRKYTDAIPVVLRPNEEFHVGDR